jgi:hypothetical protein
MDEDEWGHPAMAEADPWAPVQVPFRKPAAAAGSLAAHAPLFAAPKVSLLSSSSSSSSSSDLCAAMSEDALAAEEQDLYFLQLPTALPPLCAARLRYDRPGGLAFGLTGTGAASSASAGAGGGAHFPPPPPSSATAAPPPWGGSSAASGGGACVTVPAGAGEHKQGALGELAEGFFGTVKVHASGRTVLHLGDSTYELKPGTRTAFAQQVSCRGHL